MISLRALLREALEDQFSLEGRLPRTLLALLGRPGQLTADYAAGRIARYIPPFRLYFVSGLLFLLTVSWVASFERLWGTTEGFFGELTPEQVSDPAFDFTVVNLQLDSLAAPAPLRPLVRRYVRREAALNAMPPREAVRIVYGGLLGNVSAVLFVLVPAFALLLKALHPRRLYVEHFVFMLHLHTAAFLAALIPLLVAVRWMVGVFGLWFAAYLYLALRRVYRRGRLATAAGWSVMAAGYLLAIVAVLLAVIFLTVLTY
jgi:hypothetical protein